MSYEKQTWNKYDDLKTEEENIENGAVVTDNRMNHIEEGIEANDKANASQSQSINKHMGDTANPHKVTAAQVGLGNVQNFGLATEDEAKQGDRNAKYMTPSLTQAVLSANINSIAYANSADGTDGFTTVYPNLNLLVKTNQGVVNWRWALSDGDASVEEVSVDGIRAVKLIKGTTTKSTSWNYISYDGLLRKLIQPSTKYVLSFDVKPSVDVSFIATLMKGDGLGRLTDDTAMNKASANQWTKVSCVLTSRETFPDDLYQKVYLRGMSTANGSWLIIKNIKLEQGSTATPYMPAPSEVKTADWPKYVGFSNTVKTNKSASDYTWFPVKDSELTNKVDSHVNNKANPHAVTASQVGAYSKQEIDTKLSKAVMADNSGKVILKDFEVNGSLTLPTKSWSGELGGGIILRLRKKGTTVEYSIGGEISSSILANSNLVNLSVPNEFCPRNRYSLVGHMTGRWDSFHIDITSSGACQWFGPATNSGTPRGTGTYPID